MVGQQARRIEREGDTLECGFYEWDPETGTSVYVPCPAEPASYGTTPEATPGQARSGILLAIGALAVLGIGTYLLAGRK